MSTVRYTNLGSTLLSENRNGSKRDYVSDPLGSSVALLDNTQTETDTYSYWPFGGVRSSTGTTPTSFRYGGAIGYHSLGGTIYIRARNYIPSRGRWLTHDPLNRRSVSNYKYCSNSPVSSSDPWGLDDWVYGKGPICALAVAAALYKIANDMKDYTGHCLIGCEITQACGANWGAASAIVKELFDFAVPGFGSTELRDIVNTVSGVQVALDSPGVSCFDACTRLPLCTGLCTVLGSCLAEEKSTGSLYGGKIPEPWQDGVPAIYNGISNFISNAGDLIRCQLFGDCGYRV